MKVAAGVLLIAAIAVPAWLQQFVRPTNSRAAVRDGVKQYGKKAFKEAAESFHQADSIDPSPITSYDLGTAHIATGNGEEGARTLEGALRDPSLRPDALFNRGNAQLDAKKFDQAINDYKEALRLRPADAGAKRNLEIALRKKREQQQTQSPTGQDRQQQQQQQEQQQQQSQNENQQQPKDDRGSQTESLLRSIAQQEREELERMRRQGSTPRRIGW